MTLETLNWWVESAIYLFIIVVCLVCILVIIGGRLFRRKARPKPDCFGSCLSRVGEDPSRCSNCFYLPECADIPVCYKSEEAVKAEGTVNDHDNL